MRTHRHLYLVAQPRVDQDGNTWHNGSNLVYLLNTEPVLNAISVLRREGLTDPAITAYYEVFAPALYDEARRALAWRRVVIGPIP